MYILMNKDQKVASFTIENNGVEEKMDMIQQDTNSMPAGFDNIKEWISQRKGSKHNHYLRELMTSCGCNTAEGFIRVTHAASINDTFWIKMDKEDAQWKDISLYRNEFNETISRLAFEGVGLYGLELSTTSPELSTEGSFRKCWKREEGGIYLYKRGSTGARNAGLEPYCEAMASEVAEKLCTDAVHYDVVRFRGQIASRCKLFTNEQYGYVPIARYMKKYNEISDLIAFYKKIESEEMFRRMVVLDAITFNVDRHMGNYGVLIDNDTLRPLKMAPIFDMNLSLLPYIEETDFEHIGNVMLSYAPHIGEDFTRIGQYMLTSDIRSDLVALKGFQFKFRGDTKFPEKRVMFLEEMVNRQIEAILNKNILFTKDVFIPLIEENIKEQDISNQNKAGTDLGNTVINKRICDDYFFIEEENHIEIGFTNSKFANVEIYVNMSDASMWMELDGNEVSYEDCLMQFPDVAKWYTEVASVVDQMGNASIEKQKNINDNEER